MREPYPSDALPVFNPAGNKVTLTKFNETYEAGSTRNAAMG